MRIVGGISGAILSALLLLAASPPAGIGILGWFAPIPLLLVIRAVPAGLGIASVFLSFTLFFLVHLSFLNEFWAPAPLLAAPLSALPYLLLALSYGRSPRAWAAGAAWTGAEFLRTLGPLGLPWGCLGATQADFPGIRQLAAAGGVHSITLLMVFSAALFIEKGGSARRKTAAILIPLAFSLGGRILTPSAAVGGRALIVQGNFDPYEDDETSSILDDLESLTKDGPRADLIIWSETVLKAFPEGRPDLIERVSRISREAGAPILLGMPTLRGDERLNSIIAVDSSGERGRYSKTFLVPFGEYIPIIGADAVRDLLPPGTARFSPGWDPRPVGVREINPGFLICFEGAFGRFAARRVERGADILVNQTNDAWSRSESEIIQHFNLTRFRPIETGRWLLRCANSGISASIDPSGRIPGSMGPGERGAILVPFGPPARRTTPYLVFGDFVGYLSLAALIIPFGLTRDRTI